MKREKKVKKVKCWHSYERASANHDSYIIIWADGFMYRLTPEEFIKAAEKGGGK